MDTTLKTLSRETREILDELGISHGRDENGSLIVGDEHGGRYTDPSPTVDDVERAAMAVADAAAFRDAAHRFETFHDVLAAGGWKVGDRVEGGDTPEDYDTGRVIDVDGRPGMVEVAWDSGVATWTPAGVLRVPGDSLEDNPQGGWPVARDETRMLVDGEEIPPYEGAVAYVRRTDGVHGVRYADGYTDWLGTAYEAYGDSEITLHPTENGR